MNYETIVVDTPAEQVARITLNRPEKRNAISTTMRVELLDALRTHGSDLLTRCGSANGAAIIDHSEVQSLDLAPRPTLAADLSPTALEQARHADEAVDQIRDRLLAAYNQAGAKLRSIQSAYLDEGLFEGFASVEVAVAEPEPDDDRLLFAIRKRFRFADRLAVFCQIAEYLIDATGTIRHVDFGEGEYAQTEGFIRQLLTAANPNVRLPAPTEVADTTPTESTTPETYLGYQHPPQTLAGQTILESQLAPYAAPATIPQDEYAYNGDWTIGGESSVAGAGASIQLRYQAQDVYLVLGGTGMVTVSVNGAATNSVVVSGEPKLYQLVGTPGTPDPQAGLLSAALTPGLAAYDFTFG